MPRGLALQGDDLQYKDFNLASKQIPESTRKQVFQALVEVEDQGQTPAEARRQVAARFRITPEQVKSIEEEGIEKTWPPLEPCDDD